MKKVVVLQSNYIPWKGYFDLIHDADCFIFYDDVQYTKNDWRNRNKIMMADGPKWLTIPTGTDAHRLICEVELPDASWQPRHWESIRQSYRRAPYFKHYRPFFEEIYLGRRWHTLSELNHHMIKRIACELLNIKTEFDDSRNYSLSGQRLDRLINLVTQCRASQYISGPAAKNYIEPQRFDEIGVDLVWKDYSGYPAYEQGHLPFEHGVSIIDMLFNVGPAAPDFIWSWRNRLTTQ